MKVTNLEEFDKISEDFYLKNNSVRRSAVVSSLGLKLIPFSPDEEYRKKWNESMNDFVILVKNGIPVNNYLLRKGGFGGNIDKKY